MLFPFLTAKFGLGVELIAPTIACKGMRPGDKDLCRGRNRKPLRESHHPSPFSMHPLACFQPHGTEGPWTKGDVACVSKRRLFTMWATSPLL